MDTKQTALGIAALTIGKVSPVIYHQTVQEIIQLVNDAYENAAIIAENCSQDEAARDEPFRIAQTIRLQKTENTD